MGDAVFAPVYSLAMSGPAPIDDAVRDYVLWGYELLVGEPLQPERNRATGFSIHLVLRRRLPAPANRLRDQQRLHPAATWSDGLWVAFSAPDQAAHRQQFSGPR